MEKYTVLYEKVGYIKVDAENEEQASILAKRILQLEGVDCEGEWDETEVLEPE